MADTTTTTAAPTIPESTTPKTTTPTPTVTPTDTPTEPSTPSSTQPTNKGTFTYKSDNANIKELNLGDNTFAALATRGLVEIKRLGSKMGADESTFYGLTGLGDLIVTCGSQHSRNRRAGVMIGKGHTIEEARKEIGMTIESVDNIDVAYKLAQKYNVEMPIVNAVYNVLYNGLDPKTAVENLMTRSLKEE